MVYALSCEYLDGCCEDSALAVLPLDFGSLLSQQGLEML